MGAGPRYLDGVRIPLLSIILLLAGCITAVTPAPRVVVNASPAPSEKTPVRLPAFVVASTDTELRLPENEHARIAFPRRGLPLQVREIHGEDVFVEIDGAVKVLERLRDLVAAYTWNDLPPDMRVTLSIGLTELEPNDTVPSLMRRVDAALAVLARVISLEEEAAPVPVHLRLDEDDARDLARHEAQAQSSSPSASERRYAP